MGPSFFLHALDALMGVICRHLDYPLCIICPGSELVKIPTSDWFVQNTQEVSRPLLLRQHVLRQFNLQPTSAEAVRKINMPEFKKKKKKRPFNLFQKSENMF